MKAIIMAGGKGTRLRSVTGDELPKSLAPVCGKPILEWQLDCLRDNGVDDIMLVVGFLGDKIKDHFGNSVQYFTEETPLGTAGALPLLSDYIGNDDFLLVFGDTIFDIDLHHLMSYHKSKNAAATLFVHPNSHPFDSDLVVLDKDNCVLRFDSKHNIRDYWYDNVVNAGLYVLSPEILLGIPTGKCDLEKDVLSKMANAYGYRSAEYIKDVGTPERIAIAERDIKSGAVAAKNRKNKQICVFLDRDGTLNKDNGLIYKPELLELEDTAAEAIRMLNSSQYLCAVVTNQPSVARGLCGIEDIEEINRKFVTLLGQQGAYLDDLEYCPHHPDKGYPEENPLYKIDCDCRKPKTGMLTKIAERHNIDLSRSWIVGDTERDIQAGINAGCKTVLVSNNNNVLDAVKVILNAR